MVRTTESGSPAAGARRLPTRLDLIICEKEGRQENLVQVDKDWISRSNVPFALEPFALG